jgi:hypothetical protein
MLGLGLLLTACSNILLVSQRISLQSGGVNVVSIRDVLLGGIIFLAWPFVARLDRRRIESPLSLVVIACACYAPALALIGWLQGNPTRDIVTDLVIVWGWLVGVVVLAVIKREEDAAVLARIFVALGLLVAAGVFGEIYFRVPLVTGAASRATIDPLAWMVRPCPTGQVFILISCAFLFARLLFDNDLAMKGRAWICLLAGMEALAAILTQTRTLLVCLVVSFLAVACIKRRRLTLSICLGVSLAAGVWIGAMAIGDRAMGTQYSAYMEDRFAVFWNSSEASKYDQDAARTADMRAFWANPGWWMVWGSGLGDPIERVNPAMPAGTDMTDVGLVFIGTRFGALGLLNQLIFGTFAVWSIWRLRREAQRASWVSVGYAASVLSVFVSSFAANTLATTYSGPPAMIVFFVSESLRLGGNRRPQWKWTTGPSRLAGAAGNRKAPGKSWACPG